MTHQTATETHKNYRQRLGQEFGDVFYLSFNEWCDLQQIWAQFENLFGHGPERVALMNEAGAGFFYYVDRLFFEASMLALCRLSDPMKSAGKENLTVMLFMKFMDNDVRKAKMQALLDTATASTNFARDWRNRKIGHNDLNLKMGTALPLEDATRNLVNQAITALHGVFEYVTVEFMNTNLGNKVIAGLNNEMVMLHRLLLGVEQNARVLEDLKLGKLDTHEWPKWLRND
jgi:AbiU2